MEKSKKSLGLQTIMMKTIPCWKHIVKRKNLDIVQILLFLLFQDDNVLSVVNIIILCRHKLTRLNFESTICIKVVALTLSFNIYAHVKSFPKSTKKDQLL